MNFIKGLINVYTIELIKHKSDRPHGNISNDGTIISKLFVQLFVSVYSVTFGFFTNFSKNHLSNYQKIIEIKDGNDAYSQMNAQFHDFYLTSQVVSIRALILIWLDNVQILCFQND